MTALRPGVVLAATQKATSMGSYGANKMYIRSAGRMTWSKKPFILCNAPYTIESPHVRQAAVRVVFGKMAREYEALSPTEKERLKRETGLPGAAGYIKGKSVKDRVEREFPGVPYAEKPARRSYHTIEELERYVQEVMGYEIVAGRF